MWFCACLVSVVPTFFHKCRIKFIDESLFVCWFHTQIILCKCTAMKIQRSKDAHLCSHGTKSKTLVITWQMVQNTHTHTQAFNTWLWLSAMPDIKLLKSVTNPTLQRLLPVSFARSGCSTEKQLYAKSYKFRREDCATAVADHSAF